MEPWCLVFYLADDEHVVTAMIPESKADVAKRCGWHVFARESVIQPPEIDPAQSNPRRVGDE